MKDKKIYLGVGIVFLLIITVSFSYAYFSIKVSGNDSAKDVVVTAGTLSLVYTDGPEIKVENIRPGKTITKEVTVKNTGTLDTNYNIIWQSLINEIINDELVLSATCERLNSSGTVEGTCDSISQAPISDMTIVKKISIESGITHKYIFTILFKETNAAQNYNQGKKFSGVLGIEENKDDSTTPLNCTYDGELVQGAEYVNGQYVYRYMQEYRGEPWKNITDDGWGVALNKSTNNENVTSKLCSSINEKPIVSMSYLFANSGAKAIDLSSFDTSNVTKMHFMFYNSDIKILDLSHFNTSNVTSMSYMFSGSKATALDLSNFDTSNVTSMDGMFQYSQVTTIKGLDKFNTSNVTSMSYMFFVSQVTELNLGGFDTSKVTNMSNMFDGSINLRTIYINSTENSDGFDISNLKYGYDNAMFMDCTSLVGGAGTTYNEEHIDSEYAHIDYGEDYPGYFTDIADKK